jgi:hypothetical protein
MKYTIIAALLFAAACGSSDKTSTGPATVASVQLNASSATIAVGANTTLTATALDGSGNSIAGQIATWQTSSAAIATVAGGLITGVSAGTATITATIGTMTSQAIITVTAPIAASCTGVTPLALTVGAVHVLTAAERSTLCIAGGAGASEYVLVPFKSDTVASTVSVSMTPSGTTAAVGAPTAASASVASFNFIPSSAPVRAFRSATHGARGAAFEHQLRVKERATLSPLVSATPRSTMLRGMQRASAGRSEILGLAATPTVGTFFQLNTDALDSDDGCTAPRINHTSRIAAVSTHAIVAVDSLAPAGGFTDADYASFAASFDTLIFPLDTAAYGAPADLDNNGRVLLFFTQTVNQLTAPGSDGFIGGFFYGRDLFPVAAQSALLRACPASNQGEMFYLPVADPANLYNNFFTVKDSLFWEINATLAHEFQHLINASRRLYVTQTANWDEDVWLNEGMSHIAEELLYFHQSGFAPKQALTLQTVAGTNKPALTAINHDQLENLFRLEDYLNAPGINSPYAENDDLPTRGATYELLRYALDMSSGTNSSYLHALISTTNTGTANFNTVFGATFSNIFAAVQQQVLANFFTGSGIPVDPKYSFPSWNYRDVIGNGLGSGANPLATRQLTGATATTLIVTGGGAGYARFHVNAGATASVATQFTGTGSAAAVVMILVRTL